MVVVFPNTLKASSLQAFLHLYMHSGLQLRWEGLRCICAFIFHQPFTKTYAQQGQGKASCGSAQTYQVTSLCLLSHKVLNLSISPKKKHFWVRNGEDANNFGLEFWALLVGGGP